jgi:hypothetical protein
MNKLSDSKQQRFTSEEFISESNLVLPSRTAMMLRQAAETERERDKLLAQINEYESRKLHSFEWGTQCAYILHDGQEWWPRKGPHPAEITALARRVEELEAQVEALGNSERVLVEELHNTESNLRALGCIPSPDGKGWMSPCLNLEPCEWVGDTPPHPALHCFHCECGGSKFIPIPAPPETEGEKS